MLLMTDTITAPITIYQDTILAPLSEGLKGDKGDKGDPGISNITYPAAQALGGHRVVILNDGLEADYADATDLTHINRILGLTLGAVIQGDAVTILTGGDVIEPSWSWTLGLPVYLGSNGLLTQTRPIIGFNLIVGFPLSATEMFFQKREPIILT